MSIYKDEHKTKDGRCYFFQIMKNGKLYKSKRYLTRKEALEEEALFVMKKTNPTHKSFRLVSLDFFRNLEQIRKGSTIQTYQDVYNKHISPYFDEMDIGSINIPILKDFREKAIKQGYSVAYLNKINNVINSILDYAVVNYVLPSNLNKLLGSYEDKKDKVVKDEDKLRYITYEEFQKFIAVVDRLDYKAFFSMLYYTGMRKGEILALRVEDLHDDTIIVNKTLYTKIKGTYTITSTKNNLNRIVKMNKALRDVMDEYIDHMKSYTDYKPTWFLFGGPTYLAPTTIDRYKKHYFQLSGIHEITIHQFRHSAVSLLASEVIKRSNSKVDTASFFLQMSKRFGHSPEVMQRTYMHLFKDNQDEIVDILDNL